MFETATFDSMGTIHTRSRNWMLATFSFNASILVLLIAIPLLHPAMLPQMVKTWLVEAPAPPPAEEPKPVCSRRIRRLRLPRFTKTEYWLRDRFQGACGFPPRWSLRCLRVRSVSAAR